MVEDISAPRHMLNIELHPRIEIWIGLRLILDCQVLLRNLQQLFIVQHHQNILRVG